MFLIHTPGENHWLKQCFHVIDEKSVAQSLSNVPSTTQLKGSQGRMTAEPLLLTLL
jgi:hypothetical protein